MHIKAILKHASSISLKNKRSKGEENRFLRILTTDNKTFWKFLIKDAPQISNFFITQ
jgi:hypothetical protein